MAPDVAPGIERIAGRPVDVDPTAIEDEFARIWRDASGTAYDESSIRLRVLNLVAIGAGDDDAARFDAVMRVMPRRHPCRGILALTAGDDSAVTAAISAHLAHGETAALDVWSEELLLAGGAMQQRELASAVLALLVSEIPVVAWAIGDADLSSYLASEILHAADVLLADSGASALGPALRAQLDAQAAHDLRLFDLAWGRTESWRELLAQCFDGDERLRQLDQVTSIEIRGHAGRASAEPMLLAGWLISRLGLSLADLDGEDGRLHATLYDGTRGVALDIGPGWAPANMSHIRMTTPAATFELQAHEMSQHLHVIERWTGEESRRTVAQPAPGDAALVLMALDPAPDPRIALEAAAAALALLGE